MPERGSVCGGRQQRGWQCWIHRREALLIGGSHWRDGCEKDQLGALLDEDPALMEKRAQLAKRLELYKQAMDDINSVAWNK
ncbi:hypothetical protein JHK86_018949 [Glycine max]|nr:hypothetical protein JHK86_018949 [Glycine max]